MPTVTDDLISLVKHFEGLHDGDRKTAILEPIMCPAGKWTVGWGYVLTVGGRQLAGEADRAAAFAEWRRRWPAGMTRADADIQLAADMRRHAAAVATLVPVPLSDAELGALTSYDYNTGGLAGSTLRRKLNAGDRAGAAAEFDKWVKATVNGRKVTLPGLVKRRAAERALFEGGDWRAAIADAPMVQAVEPPAEMKPLAESRTLKGASVATAAAAAVPVLQAVGAQLEQVRTVGAQVRQIADLLPAGAAPWCMVAALAAGLAYVVWRRIDDHRRQEAS